MDGYAFVNEKTVGDRTYRAYRSVTNPRDCLIEIVETGETIAVQSLRQFWNTLGAS